MAPPRSDRDRGSVLVDALVAVAIMALTLTFASEAVGDGALRTRAAERSRTAQLEARSRLAEVGADIPLSPGRVGGEDAGLVWTAQIEPAPASLSGGSERLLSVTVTVADDKGAELARLQTLRIEAP